MASRNTAVALGVGSAVLVATVLAARAQTGGPATPPPPAPATPAGDRRASAEAGAVPAVGEKGGGTRGVTPLLARDVIERLKTVRSEIVLEQEYVNLLEARLERLELEAKIAAVEAGMRGAGKPTAPPRLTQIRRDVESDLIVKALTLRPFKEAIVTYRGRVYTVRPGDRLGPFTIVDINENGVQTGGKSVLVGE